MSTIGSCTTTRHSTAKLEISLLLKPSSTPPLPFGTYTEDAGVNDRPSRITSGRPALDFAMGEVPEELRRISDSSRISESSTTSILTTPTLATATTSRQPSLPAVVTPDPMRASTEVVPPFRRPFLPPLDATSPPPSHSSLHPQSILQHQIPSFLSPHYQLVQPAVAYSSAKRQRTSSPPTQITTPAKRQSKWTAEEDALIIELRGSNMKWEDISRHLPGRSAISCRLHYQNYLERRSEWDEEKKNRLARLYERLKPEMWGTLATELGIPWRAAEAMHWQLGEAGMASRAGVTPFSLTSVAGQTRQSPFQVPAVPVQHVPGHHRGHSDPAYDNMHSHRYPQQQLAQEARFLRPGQTLVKEEGFRFARPPSPVLHLPPDEQSYRTLPSMAELDQGLTAAAMADAHRNISPPRR